MLEAFWGWVAGMVIGALPLIAHCVMEYATTAGDPAETGNFVVEVLFWSISAAGTSLTTMFARPGGVDMLRGRAGPLLAGLLMVAVVVAALLYGAEVSGLSAPYALAMAWGLFVGTAIVSLFFDLGLAARTN